MPGIEAVLMDFDDTLVETYEISHRWMQEVARAAGIRVPAEEEIRKLWGKLYIDVVRSLWPDKEDFDMYMAQECKVPYEYVPVSRGAKEVMEYLMYRVPMGIVTSRKRDEFFVHAEKSGLDLKLFKWVLTSSDTEYHKPDPRVFDTILKDIENYGIGKTGIVYVGDNHNDYIAARDAGLQFFGVTTGVTAKEDFLAIGLEEKNILSSMAELPGRLKL
jgi:HAD superfamily hydrolase (TIGR01549 family)